MNSKLVLNKKSISRFFLFSCIFMLLELCIVVTPVQANTTEWINPDYVYIKPVCIDQVIDPSAMFVEDNIYSTWTTGSDCYTGVNLRLLHNLPIGSLITNVEYKVKAYRKDVDPSVAAIFSGSSIFQVDNNTCTNITGSQSFGDRIPTAGSLAITPTVYTTSLFTLMTPFVTLSPYSCILFRSSMAPGYATELYIDFVSFRLTYITPTNTPTPTPTLTPIPTNTPEPTAIPTVVSTPSPTVEPTPKPFLIFPYDYQSKGKTFDDVALNPESWFDHEYPLADLACCTNSIVRYDSFGEKVVNAYVHHNGYDYSQYKDGATPGTDVLAAASGSATFKFEGDKKGYGNIIKISHPNGFQTWYGHLDYDEHIFATISADLREKKTLYVNQGDKIGEVGTVGNSTGYHLHFTVVKDLDNDGEFEDDSKIGAIDPLGWKEEDEKGVNHTDPWTTYKIGDKHGPTSYNLFTERVPETVQEFTKDNGVATTAGNLSVTVLPNSIPVDNAKITIEKVGFDKITDKNGNRLESIMPSFILMIKSFAGDLLDIFSLPITLSYDYKDADLTNIDQDSIQYYYLNEDTNNWEPLTTKEHDKENKIITAETNHNSRFALIGRLKDTVAPETKLLIDKNDQLRNWYNKQVTVSFVTDDPSTSVGIGHTFYSDNYSNDERWKEYEGNDILFQNEGNYSITYYSIDKGGNTEGLKTSAIGIDLSSPSTTANISNDVEVENGWYKSDIDVELSANDNDGSGISKIKYSLDDGTTFNDYSEKITISSEGIHTLKYYAEDKAGNIEEVKSKTVKIDKTAPDTLGVTSGILGSEKWYKSDVNVELRASDNIPGENKITTYYKINNAADYTKYTDIFNLSNNGVYTISFYSEDEAGNKENPQEIEIKIDKTEPEIMAMLSVGGNQYITGTWTNQNVTVTFDCSDTFSGVNEKSDPVIVTEEGSNKTVTGACVDKAGNKNSKEIDGINIDKTKPEITYIDRTKPNSKGWNNNYVTVNWTCSDTLSGVIDSSINKTLSSEGESQSLIGTCTDKAGNSISNTQNGINIDKTVPQLRPTVTPNPVLLFGTATVSSGAEDALSGIERESCNTPDTSKIGTYTVDCNATDKAGNEAKHEVQYRVNYRFDGFLQPINDTTYYTGLETSIFKSGSSVPVKFQLKDANGSVIQAENIPQWLNPIRGSAMSKSIDESVYTIPATSGNSFRWDATNMQYIYIWSTKEVTGGYYYKIGFITEGGQKNTVNIGLR